MIHNDMAIFITNMKNTVAHYKKICYSKDNKSG